MAAGQSNGIVKAGKIITRVVIRQGIKRVIVTYKKLPEDWKNLRIGLYIKYKFSNKIGGQGCMQDTEYFCLAGVNLGVQVKYSVRGGSKNKSRIR